MYLSKVTLKPSPDLAKTLLKLGGNGVYSAHQLLWQLFRQENSRPFIFREEQGRDGLPMFFVLSSCAPVNAGDIFRIQTKPFSPQLQQGQRLAFKLRANPTICIDNKRHDVMMHAKRQLRNKELSAGETQFHMEQAAQNWLCDEKRMESWGIQLAGVPDIEAYTQHRSRKRSGQNVQFSSVDFQGILTVTEPSKFLNQYEKGFGRAKSLGCGLMLIRLV
jgi:CRISPR system Cascade subunit CasE